MFKKMVIEIDGVIFEKVIGEQNIYAEQYGVYIPNSSEANTFDEMIDISTNWLAWQE